MTLKPILLAPVRFVARGAVAVRERLRDFTRSFRFWALCVLGVIVLLVAYYVLADRRTPLTTDAYVQAYVVQVAPQVGGQVVRVYVHEGERVTKGQHLFDLDPRPFEHKVSLLVAKLALAEQDVKRLRAEVAAAHAEHARLRAEAEYAEAVFQQEESIYWEQSTTERKYLDALQKHRASGAALERSAQVVKQAQELLDARVNEEHALVAQAKAQLAEAKLDLAYAKVYAPCDGIITDLQLREGAYAHVGQAVLTCIDTTQWLVVANFRENSLVRMREGQPALVAFQGEPGRLHRATIHSIGWGVGQGQGVPSGMLPEVKNQSSWVPLSQRFQVRLTLDEPGEVPLRVGMTGSVSVYTETEGPVKGITEAIHRVLAWLYYL